MPDGLLSAAEMLAIELHYRDRTNKVQKSYWPFENIPFAFLKWNEGAVRKRTLRPGDYFCPRRATTPRRRSCWRGQFTVVRVEKSSAEPRRWFEFLPAPRADTDGGR